MEGHGVEFDTTQRHSTHSRMANEGSSYDRGALARKSVLYVVESRAVPHRRIWAYDHQQGRLSNKRLAIDAQCAGAIDGFRLDIAGNLWCG